MHIQKVNNTSFKMNRLASAEARFKQTVNKFELYRITPEDKDYLSILLQSIKLKELMPNLKPEYYFLWQRILEKVLSTYNETILLTKDNIPCGGLKYRKNSNHYEILGRVTWPIEQGKREPFAGKVLTMQLFKIFMQDNLNMIRTCVVRNSPFGTISKVRDMGFSSYGGDNFNELMCITRARIEKAMEKFKDIIFIEEESQQ